MKAKAAAAEESTYSGVECDDGDRTPHTTGPSFPAASSTESTSITDHTDSIKSSIVELQKQLQCKFSKNDNKESLQGEKDAFADIMKTVTYLFPSPF